ncbi:helix-turn-helix domain-containing protein [Chitinophaga sp. RAB17]|uniref:helix-turn-helix domain-containing protein n=1 Tax=Chitinophaga sp. RAB17 TaxID=3233049 RepID=UPI003F932ED0
MHLRCYAIHPLLKEYILRIFLLEHDSNLKEEDLKLIVPNGLPKIVIPFSNGISSIINGVHQCSGEKKLTLIGNSDVYSHVSQTYDSGFQTIGIEFSPRGAYRFFRFDLEEIANCAMTFDTVFGSKTNELQEKINDAETVDTCIHILQEFLLKNLDITAEDPLITCLVEQIMQKQGMLSVGQLEKISGYSSRWLRMKFLQKVGISPKAFTSVVRFQQFYSIYTQQADIRQLSKEFYHYYYDQSHFIKDFRKYTGLPPGKFHQQENEYGRIFYKNRPF